LKDTREVFRRSGRRSNRIGCKKLLGDEHAVARELVEMAFLIVLLSGLDGEWKERVD
jgi:hypothetical protein